MIKSVAKQQYSNGLKLSNYSRIRHYKNHTKPSIKIQTRLFTIPGTKMDKFRWNKLYLELHKYPVKDTPDYIPSDKSKDACIIFFVLNREYAEPHYHIILRIRRLDQVKSCLLLDSLWSSNLLSLLRYLSMSMEFVASTGKAARFLLRNLHIF